MEQNKAIQVLVDAVNLAQKRGAYNFAEAEQIINAIKIFTTPVKKDEIKEKIEEIKKVKK